MEGYKVDDGGVETPKHTYINSNMAHNTSMIWQSNIPRIMFIILALRSRRFLLIHNECALHIDAHSARMSYSFKDIGLRMASLRPLVDEAAATGRPVRQIAAAARAWGRHGGAAGSWPQPGALAAGFGFRRGRE